MILHLTSTDRTHSTNKAPQPSINTPARHGSYTQSISTTSYKKIMEKPLSIVKDAKISKISQKKYLHEETIT